MYELEIREMVTIARYLLKTFNACTTDQDYKRFYESLSNLCVDASAKMQALTRCGVREAADIFMQIVEDDAKLETFIAQAFVAQVFACA